MPASAGSIGQAYVAEGPAPYAYWGPQGANLVDALLLLHKTKKKKKRMK